MNDVIEAAQQESAIVQQDSTLALTSPAGMMLAALKAGASLEQVEKMMDLQERWEANEARKAFVEAMAEFKKNPPEIFKSKAVGFDSRDGGSRTSYMHATLADVVEPTVAALARHGFSHRWDTQQPDGGQIVVSCILTHAKGHSEATTLKAGSDQSGKKNAIQAVASTVTYLERYTLLSACGLAAKDMQEDDGGYTADDGPDISVEAMINAARQTTTDADALSYWKDHNSLLKDWPREHRMLKDAVSLHRAELAKGTPQ